MPYFIAKIIQIIKANINIKLKIGNKHCPFVIVLGCKVCCLTILSITAVPCSHTSDFFCLVKHE